MRLSNGREGQLLKLLEATNYSLTVTAQYCQKRSNGSFLLLRFHSHLDKSKKFSR